MKEIINQLFEIEQKAKNNNIGLFDRNLKRLYHEMETMGYVIKNPENERFSEERTDIEAKISGKYQNNMNISKVLKPIIYKQDGAERILVQRGIVIVE